MIFPVSVWTSSMDKTYSKLLSIRISFQELHVIALEKVLLF